MTDERSRAWLWRLPVGLAVAVLALAFGLGYLWNEDLGWYLASGARILDAGAVPQHDDFLYSHGGTAGFISHSWLWTALLAALYRGGGTLGLAVFDSLALLAIVLALLLWVRIDRFGLAGGVAALAVLVVGGSRLLLRAELASWLLLLAQIAILERQARARWSPFALIALQLLWANVHGGFLLGILAVTAYAVGGRVPLWTPAAVIGVSLLKPGGILPELQRAGYGWTAATASPVLEWRPTYLQLGTREPWLLGAFVLVALLTFPGTRSSKRLGRLLLLTATTLAGIAAVRFVVAAVLCAVLVALLNLRDRVAARALRPGRLLRWAHAGAVIVFCVCVVALAAGTWSARADLEAGQSRGAVTLGPASTAPGAADYILAHDLPAPLFNDMELGGYLEQRLYPRHRLFIDSRNLSLDLLQRYVRILTSRPAWQQAEAEFGFRTVVLSHLGLPASLPLRAFLLDDPRWQRVYLDPQAVIFVRVDGGTSSPPQLDAAGRAPAGVPYLATGSPAFRALRSAATRVLLRLDSDELMYHYLAVLGELGETESILALSSAALEQRPRELELVRTRGIARVFSKRYELAIVDLRRVLEQRPHDGDARLLMAVALEQLERAPEAKH